MQLAQLVGLEKRGRITDWNDQTSTDTPPPELNLRRIAQTFLHTSRAGLMDAGQYLSSLPDFNGPAGRATVSHYLSLPATSGLGLYINACTQAPSPHHPDSPPSLPHQIYASLPTKKLQQPAAGLRHGGSGSPASRGSFGCALGRQLIRRERDGLEGRGGSAAGGRGWLRQVLGLLPQRCRCLQRYMQCNSPACTLALLV